MKPPPGCRSPETRVAVALTTAVCGVGLVGAGEPPPPQLDNVPPRTPARIVPIALRRIVPPDAGLLTKPVAARCTACSNSAKSVCDLASAPWLSPEPRYSNEPKAQILRRSSCPTVWRRLV